MASYYKVGNSFTVAFRLFGGPRQYIRGIKREDVARKARDQKSCEEEMARAGLLKFDHGFEKLRLSNHKAAEAHIVDFQAFLIAAGDKTKHAMQQVAHIRRLFSLAGISKLVDLELDRIQKAIAQLHAMKKSPRTCNAARGAVIHFERWLLRDGKIARAVLQDLRPLNEQADVRRRRRALSQEEVDWLLRATENSTTVSGRSCGISSIDRAMLYRVALSTGFRRAALLSLRKEDFHVSLDVARPFIRLLAENSKNGKQFEQQISADLARALRLWLKEKAAGKTVWQPRPHADLAIRFRRDLEAARAAWILDADKKSVAKFRAESDTLRYVIQTSSGPIFADFHSLRHTSITAVVRAAGIWVGQNFADHSTPVLTMKYAHLDDGDVDKGIAALPSLGESRLKSDSDSASAKRSARGGLLRPIQDRNGHSQGPKTEQPAKPQVA